MLAGRMKLKNFALLAGLAGLGGLGALWFAAEGPEDEVETGPDLQEEHEAQHTQADRVQGAKPVFEGEEDPEADRAWQDVPISELDRRVLAELDRAMSSEKTKDAWGAGAEKLNVYDDDGDGKADRAKLDWDRDDKPDQKFEVKDGRLRMFWAPEDDEVYSQEFELEPASEGWMRRNGEILYVTWEQVAPHVEADPLPAGMLPAEEAPAQADPPADALTAELLSWQGKQAAGGKLKDVSKGKAWKINVYQDAGEASINRAKVDLDRDDKWDIKVTFGQPVTRKVSPSDDENYTVEESWDGSAWN